MAAIPKSWGAVVASVLFIIANAVVPAQSETLKFTLPEAREIALRASVSGQPGMALTLTQQLLAKDPNDSTAHLATGTAHLSLGRWKDAYRGGRLAFRHSDTQVEKFQAARVTALAAMADNRTMLSQFWFRRAGDLAPTEADRNRIKQQFRVVQSRSPWNFRFNFSSTPSSNVNGGSEVSYNIIDGVPLVGILSADAQALSGLVSQGSVRGSYRFAASARSQSFVTASVFHKAVMLSDDARRAAPNFDATTLNATSLDVGLSHARLVSADNNTLVKADIGARSYWRGDVLTYRALTAGGEVQHKISPQLTFTGALSGELRQYDGGGEGRIGTATLGLSYGFKNGNRISGFLSTSKSMTPIVTFDSRSVTGKLNFSLGKPVLSVLWSAGIGFTQSRYDDYRLGFIVVPGGRQDDTVFMDLEARFIGVEYAGFSPSVKLRRTRTDSNITRYDTNEWALSFGINSNF